MLASAWSNDILKPNGHAELCACVSSHTIIGTSLSVHIYVCVCLSTCHIAPLFKILADDRKSCM